MFLVVIGCARGFLQLADKHKGNTSMLYPCLYVVAVVIRSTHLNNTLLDNKGSAGFNGGSIYMGLSKNEGLEALYRRDVGPWAKHTPKHTPNHTLKHTSEAHPKHTPKIYHVASILGSCQLPCIAV